MQHNRFACLPLPSRRRSFSLSLSLSLSAYRTRFGEAPRLWSRARHSRSMMDMAYICSNQSSCMLLCGGCSESMTSKLRPSFPSVVVQRVVNGKKRTGVARPDLASLDTSHQYLAAMLHKSRWVPTHPILITVVFTVVSFITRCFSLQLLKRFFLVCFSYISAARESYTASSFQRSRRLVPAILNKWQDANC